MTGDYTYNLNKTNFSKALNKAIKNFEWVRNSGGVFVLNNHIQRSESIFDLLSALHKELAPKTDFIRLRDVAL